MRRVYSLQWYPWILIFSKKTKVEERSKFENDFVEHSIRYRESNLVLTKTENVIAYIAHRFTHTRNALSRNEATSIQFASRLKSVVGETITSQRAFNCILEVTQSAFPARRWRCRLYVVDVDVNVDVDVDVDVESSVSFLKGRSMLSQVTRSITLGIIVSILEETCCHAERSFFEVSVAANSSYVAQ